MTTSSGDIIKLRMSGEKIKKQEFLDFFKKKNSFYRSLSDILLRNKNFKQKITRKDIESIGLNRNLELVIRMGYSKSYFFDCIDFYGNSRQPYRCSKIITWNKYNKDKVTKREFLHYVRQNRGGIHPCVEWNSSEKEQITIEEAKKVIPRGWRDFEQSIRDRKI